MNVAWHLEPPIQSFGGNETPDQFSLICAHGEGSLRRPHDVRIFCANSWALGMRYLLFTQHARIHGMTFSAQFRLPANCSWPIHLTHRLALPNLWTLHRTAVVAYLFPIRHMWDLILPMESAPKPPNS